MTIKKTVLFKPEWDYFGVVIYESKGRGVKKYISGTCVNPETFTSALWDEYKCGVVQFDSIEGLDHKVTNFGFYDDIVADVFADELAKDRWNDGRIRNESVTVYNLPVGK